MTKNKLSNFLSINEFKVSINAFSWADLLERDSAELSSQDVELVFSGLLKMIKNWDGESTLYVAECIERLMILEESHPELDLQAFEKIYLMSSLLNHATKDEHKKMLHSLNDLMPPPLIMACSKEGMIVVYADSSYHRNNQIQIRNLEEEYEFYAEEIES